MGDGARDRFARQAAIVLRVAGGTDIEYNADEYHLEFTRPDGVPWILNLANVYNDWREAPHAEQIEAIKRFVTAMVNAPATPDDWPEVASSLRPVLNATAFARWNEDHDPDLQSISRDFLPFVKEMVVVDRPDSMSYITGDHLTRWKISAEEVFDRARANLAGSAYWRVMEERPTARTIFEIPESGSEFWASHLLLDGWLAGIGEQLGARPVVFVPSRDGIKVVADDPDLVGSLLEMVEKQYMEATRPVSTQAFTVDDAGRVVPYAVPRDHPLWNAVHRSELAVAARQYGIQHSENDYCEEGFVADLMTKTEEDGRMWSVAVWGEGVDTLLPVADYVVIINEAREHFTVPWDAAVRIAGLVPQPGWDPPRYLTPPWPSELQLGSLRAAAVRP